jgi:DNA-binding NtrC family response regulator
MEKAGVEKNNESNIHPVVLHVLVVDDEKTDIKVLETNIVYSGHKTHIVNGVEDARKKLSRLAFDLCFLNINISNKDGILLINEIKKFSPDTYIVAMTGDSSWEMESEIRKLRVMYFLIKPLERTELQSIISHVSKIKSGF